jgi:hypothetical protein
MAGNPARRHVWVDVSGGYRHAGLVVSWRRTSDGGWEAQVAVARDASILVQWVPADRLTPVADDGWDPVKPR